MKAITYTGIYGENDSNRLKSKGIQKPETLDRMAFSRSFNGVYSSEIKKDPETVSGDGTNAADTTGGQSAVLTELLEYLRKTPEERFFDAILKEKGLTKTQFDLLPPKEKAALSKEIIEEVKERVTADATKQAQENEQA